MDKEQIIALAEETDDGSGEQYFVDQDGWITEFATKLLESYKAELLKEVGEPVGYHYLPNNEMFPVEEVSRSNLKNNPQDYVFLYTSDQVAAAIIKATKPLKDSLAVVKKDRADLYMETLTLRDQLAKAEQRVAEACANYVNRFINGDGILNEVWISDIESALRNGEWRKHMKGD